ncbi:MAG: hypothetical protein Q9187_002110 [Circinaria calcarea]
MAGSLLPEHTFFHDNSVSAGLTRYPLTPYHTLTICHELDHLMSLSLADFLTVLNTARRISFALTAATEVLRCGLVCDGSRVISIMPFYGLSKEWSPVMHDVKEYEATFPGYITSKSGPDMANAFLDEIRAKISTVTGIREPFNNHFDGEPTDHNLFARLIRGELPEWRIWEDDTHVAFLTPFGNTPGFSVIVPRKHLSSDIFGLEDQDYADIVTAAYTVAQHLKTAFGVKKCGLFFEGYEIDYAHVKLVPIHDQDQELHVGRSSTKTPKSAPFHETYQGYLTSQPGPLASNLAEFSEQTRKVRMLLSPEEGVQQRIPDGSP